MKPATRRSIRGRLASGLNRLAQSVAMLGVSSGDTGGYKAGRRDNRKLRSWRAGEGSPATDLLPDLPTLRGRSRDLERNHPIALGGIQTKVNGVVGTGLVLKSVLDADVLDLSPEEAITKQYQIEREYELWCRTADFTGQMHWLDQQRLIYRSAKVSGDIGIVRRYQKRPGDVYGTKVVLIEADRVCNPSNASDSAQLQAGVAITADGQIAGYHFTDRHPGDRFGGTPRWSYLPRLGAAGLPLMLLPVAAQRPGQVRGIPLFAPVEQALKQMGDYTDAEIHAAVNDALLFAFEMLGAADADADHLVKPPETAGSVAGDDEINLEDLTITTLGEGSSVEVKKPSRPNTAFGDFVDAFLKYIGVALEIPFELLIMHFSASFSASRAAMELAWKGFQVDQAWLARSVLDPVREWQFTEMVTSGRFDAPGFFDDPIKRAAWLGRQWIGPTRIQINPQVESNSDKTDVEMGAKTLEQVMIERTGGDFDTKSRQVLHERQVLGRSGPSATTTPPAEKNNDGTDPEDQDANQG